PGAAIRLDVAGDGPNAVITVTDDGPGMTEAEAATAFDRFSRGDPARARATGGSGLGLAIARSLVEAHGGTLELRTSPGAGATFVATIPLGDEPAAS
ncbi:MAG: sensor histidine kinase, partial [Microthrixaceae bacterium]|nr:sensor histidine kinase [Microthrixaceae bacterium]